MRTSRIDRCELRHAGTKFTNRVNTLRPRQNGRHFADDTFKRIFINEHVRISINISLKFAPKGLINNIPALVQIMAWRRPGDKPLSEPMITGARLDARTYTFAHPIWRTTNAARKQGAISPILPVFCRYYLCDAIMLIKLSMAWPWVTGITTLEVAIVVVNFARDARMNTVNVCRMRERIKQDARTSLLMRERTHIVHWGSFY